MEFHIQGRRDNVAKKEEKTEQNRKGRRKHSVSIIIPILILIFIVFIAVWKVRENDRRNTVLRLEDYANAIDNDFEHPEKIYAFLCDDFKSKMGEDEFSAAFRKERSYPYITPLYIYDPVISDYHYHRSAKAVYTQAARLPGMTYEVSLVYENGMWDIVDWEDFPDGSYLRKLDNLNYSLSWYYDTNPETEIETETYGDEGTIEN